MRGITGRKIGIALSFAAVLLVGCDESEKVQDEAKQARIISRRGRGLLQSDGQWRELDTR